MSKLRIAIAVMAMLMGTAAKGQTAFEPMTTLCSRTLENTFCSGVASTDGVYSFSFNGGTKSVAVYENGALMLTASDLALTVTQVGTASWGSTFYRVDGTFSFQAMNPDGVTMSTHYGSFSVYMQLLRIRRKAYGTNYYIVFATNLDSTFTDDSGNVFTSEVTLP
jgi:hypothetical protein